MKSLDSITHGVSKASDMGVTQETLIHTISDILIIILLVVAIGLLLMIGYILYKKYMNTQTIVPFDPDDTSDCQTLTEKPENSKQSANIVSQGPAVFAVATETNKKGTNQDAFCKKYIQSASATVIAVADGVGSSFRSEIGSTFVANRAVELIALAIEENPKEIDFDEIFNRVQSDFDKEIETQFEGKMDTIPTEGISFATTLIVGIDFPDRFIAAYVGNGSIIHLASKFVTFPKYICIPWNAINLLNPHTISKDGKEALYQVFYYKSPTALHAPSVIEVKKNKIDGEIFIITTDGVNSNDHDIAAMDEENNIWLPVSQQLMELYNHLMTYTTSSDDINSDTLQKSVESYLIKMKEESKLDDDTTLGVFISPIAIQYFENYSNQHNS